jgi:hypothetical protein
MPIFQPQDANWIMVQYDITGNRARTRLAYELEASGFRRTTLSVWFGLYDPQLIELCERLRLRGIAYGTYRFYYTRVQIPDEMMANLLREAYERGWLESINKNTESLNELFDIVQGKLEKNVITDEYGKDKVIRLKKGKKKNLDKELRDQLKAVPYTRVEKINKSYQVLANIQTLRLGLEKRLQNPALDQTSRNDVEVMIKSVIELQTKARLLHSDILASRNVTLEQKIQQKQQQKKQKQQKIKRKAAATTRGRSLRDD